MCSTRKSDKWLLMQLTNGTSIVVNEASVISPTGEAKIGCLVIADKGDGTHGTATILHMSSDRQFLERQILPPKAHVPVPDEEKEDKDGPSNNEEPKDYSTSVSSLWEPRDENLSSDDDDEVEQKKRNMERFSRTYTNRRSSEILKPIHRVDAFNIIMSKNRKRTISEENRKEQGKNNVNFKKRSLLDSKRKNKTPDPNPKSSVVSINVRDIMDMKQCFFELFNILTELKSSTPKNNNNDDKSLQINRPPVQSIGKPEINNTLYENHVEDDCDMSDRSEEINRSDDNVLIITHKYDNTNTNKDIPAEKDKNSTEKLAEWIPIGSGKTLLHKDKYRKVNWKSYTIATRTLLFALFPKRILATHSLTGQRSPAFKKKPAKLCLDPKIVIDVIIEITNRFKVKENLVRTIITMKCNDEAKSYKMRQKQKLNRKTLPKQQLSN